MYEITVTNIETGKIEERFESGKDSAIIFSHPKYSGHKAYGCSVNADGKGVIMMLTAFANMAAERTELDLKDVLEVVRLANSKSGTVSEDDLGNDSFDISKSIDDQVKANTEIYEDEIRDEVRDEVKDAPIANVEVHVINSHELSEEDKKEVERIGSFFKGKVEKGMPYEEMVKLADDLGLEVGRINAEEVAAMKGESEIEKEIASHRDVELRVHDNDKDTRVYSKGTPEFFVDDTNNREVIKKMLKEKRNGGNLN